MAKSLKQYLDNPSKDCKNWVRKRQQSAGSLDDEEARRRLTKDWMAKEKRRRANRSLNANKIAQEQSKKV